MEPDFNKQKISTGLTAIVPVIMALAACGDKPQTPAPPKLYQQERNALEKAKGVEQTQAKSAEDLKQEMEKQAQ